MDYKLDSHCLSTLAFILLADMTQQLVGDFGNNITLNDMMTLYHLFCDTPDIF